MKAITTWQPWASLIALGFKPYEFRGWYPPKSIIGQRIGIHAAARPVRLNEVRDLLEQFESQQPPCLLPAAREAVRSFLHHPDRLPLSSVVCTTVLGSPKPGDVVAREFGVDAGNDSDREGTFNWGWPMLDVLALNPPVPWRGRQGFWDIPDDIVGAAV